MCQCGTPSSSHATHRRGSKGPMRVIPIYTVPSHHNGCDLHDYQCGPPVLEGLDAACAAFHAPLCRRFPYRAVHGLEGIEHSCRGAYSCNGLRDGPELTSSCCGSEFSHGRVVSACLPFCMLYRVVCRCIVSCRRSWSLRWCIVPAYPQRPFFTARHRLTNSSDRSPSSPSSPPPGNVDARQRGCSGEVQL